MVIFGVPVYFLLISGIGMVFAQKIQTDLISRFAASLVIGSSIIGIVMFSLAILDYIYPSSIIVVVSIAVLLTLLSSKPLWASLKGLGNFLKHYVVKNDKWSKLFIVAIVLLVTWLILLSWTPPRQADAMRYHLALSKDFVQNHGLIFRPYAHYNFPLYFNLLFLPVYMAFKGIGLQFTVLGCFILSVIFTLRLAYQLQLKYPRLLVFLFCLIPLFYHEAHQVFNDWVVVCYVIMGFVLLLDRTAKPSLLVVFLGFLSLGFALGVKYQAVLFIPWFILLGWDRLKSVKSPARRILYIFLALIPMGALASPCYIRNFINTGNPFWPLLQSLFPASNNYLSQVAKLFEASRSGNHSIGTLINSLRNYVSNPLLPGTVWPLAFLGAVLGRKTPLRIGFGLLTYVSIWWVIQPSLDCRYSMYALPIGLLAVILLYETVKSYQFPLFKLFYQAIVAITLIYGIGVGVVYSKGYIEYFFHRDLERYHQATWFYPEYMWINKTLPEDVHLLVIVSAGQTYYLDRSYLRADPPLSGMIDWTALKDVAELRKKLFQLNIDYVLYEVRDWDTPNYYMMELIEKLSMPPSQVIWDRHTLLCHSRIKKEYSSTVLRLIKLRK